ncbi:MAG TPA: ATP-binding cassette domain-containing protein [Rhodanobacteraceae bacterium]|jgi:ABC-2 type transport system ATP-binding protein|nr:ATP-binding cassette domain-containing protein [Rhodanobacteraceae bacterium]
MQNAISIEAASKHFGAHTAVDRLSLEVPAGSIYGFLGRNGAGKTTTLRMITGILDPDGGQISVLGGQAPKAVRARTGYLPEENGLYKDMQVLDMVTYFGQLRGLDRREARTRGRTRLKAAGLEASINAKCNTLSKGMAQKVQVIAAVLHDPELVVLDEPFSGLDPVNSEMVLGLIRQFKREGRTVIFSTHVVEHAEQICDAVVIIDHGQRKVNGPLAEIKARAERSVIVDYEGDAGSLAELPGVLAADDAGQHAELRLAPDADTQVLLKTLVERVRIRRFDTREATLKQIFLETVGSEHDAA